MEPWVQKMWTSDEDFQREVFPNMSATLPSGEVVSVQLEGVVNGTSTGTAGILDRDAGIDYLIRTPDGRVVTVATRTAYSTSPAYVSFTIGEYELEKRRRELETEQAIGPFFMVQGTVTCPQTGTFVCGATVETADLISFVDNFPDLVRDRANRTSGRPFYVVYAADLWDQGYPVQVNIAPGVGPIVGWP